jgi:hypothetical protein
LKESLPSHRLLFVFVIASVVIRLVFWLYTDRVWDDSLITIAHSRNAAEGLGLTHHPGEGRVHGFTSALSVLIPLCGELIRSGTGLFVMRLSSLLAGALTIVFAYLIARELKLDRFPVFFLLAFLSFDQNHIFYGMSGMETQVAAAVLLAGVYYVFRGEPLRSGLCLGLGLLARPDFVLWVLPASLYMLWRDKRAGVKAVMTAVCVTTPWLIFTSFYYGSPVPQTIRAKFLTFAAISGSASGTGVPESHMELNIPQILFDFAPFLENDFIRMPFPELYVLPFALVLIALTAAGIHSNRKVRGIYPAVAFILIFTAYRMFLLPDNYFKWYLTPYMAVVAVMAAAGLQSIGKASGAASRYLSLLLALAFAVHIPFTFPLERTVQHEIENKIRKPVGEYLHGAVSPGEAVMVEPAGYVGYYSRARLHDFPGLTSSISLGVLRNAQPEERNFMFLIDELQPEWLVLRPWELSALERLYPGTSERYKAVKHYMTDVGLSRWGVRMENIDREFLILRRID